MAHICGGFSWDDFIEWASCVGLVVIGFALGFGVAAGLYLD
jgi:hypothetical protein